MRRYLLSELALLDIDAILDRTYNEYGELARQRYELLLEQAIRDVAADPDRPGSLQRTGLVANARSYHLKYSRDHVPAAAGRVRKPRHAVVYRIRANGWIEISRVLHERMDLLPNLPPDFAMDDE